MLTPTLTEKNVSGQKKIPATEPIFLSLIDRFWANRFTQEHTHIKIKDHLLKLYILT